MDPIEPLVDIHCHLIPAIDDGSEELGRNLGHGPHGSGRRHPHHRRHAASVGRLRRQRRRYHSRRTLELQRFLAEQGVPLAVLPGADVRIEAGMVSMLLAGSVLSLADRRRHVLLELPHEMYMPLEHLLAELKSAGMVGILSHPERNQGILATPHVVPPLVDAGCLMQVTAGSLLGAFGGRVQQYTETLITQGLAHFVSTDAHGTKNRRPLLREAYQRMAQLAGPEMALELCAAIRRPWRPGSPSPPAAARRSRRPKPAGLDGSEPADDLCRTNRGGTGSRADGPDHLGRDRLDRRHFSCRRLNPLRRPRHRAGRTNEPAAPLSAARISHCPSTKACSPSWPNCSSICRACSACRRGASRSKFTCFAANKRTAVIWGSGCRRFLIAGHCSSKAADPGKIYAYKSKDLAVDVRHECTHGLLHCVLPMVPLWLDEGLAEYFEVPEEQRAFANGHLKWTRLDGRIGRVPKLVQLEAKRDVSEMSGTDYRHAWAWCHFMLHGPPEARAELVDFLADIRAGTPPGKLSDRLERRLPGLDKRLAQHFKNWKR